MKKITLLTCVVFIAMFLIGCETVPETNSNNAVVVNDNTNITNVDTNDTADADTDWTWDANVNREDYDKDRDRYDKVRKDRYEDDTIGTGANDAWLWTKTRAALATTSGLRESTINVDVENEVVTLRGTVGTDAQKADAVKVAKEIDGVKSVNDQLKVAPEDSITNTASDTDDTNANTNANR